MGLITDKILSRIIIIMGTTGSGKSALAMKLAENIPSEIISADSMQCYKMMNIGTAKPTPNEMKNTPHHLVDIFDIGQRVDLYSYVRLMDEAVKDITSKQKIAIIVGGTGLYIKSFLYGLDPIPSDESLRQFLFSKYEYNTEKLKKDLFILDPVAANLLSEKPRKMIRAMEVYKLTGKSIFAQQQCWSAGRQKHSALSYVLRWERGELYKKLSQRIENMLKNGWIEETKHLEKMGFFHSPTAKQAIGYTFVLNYLKGALSYADMQARIMGSTKKYVRRQETWFKNQHPSACIITMPQDEKAIINRIVADAKR